MGDLSHAIQAVAEGAGLAVVRSLVGHGVGRSMHEDPQVPNYGKPGKGPLLEEGMVLAIEPMTTAGAPGGARRRRRLGDLLAGRLARGALRVHGRDHRRGPADPDALALPAAERAGALAARAPSAERAPRASAELGSCYHAGPARARAVGVRRGKILDSVAAAGPAARAGSPEQAPERDHEGKTVGQADVREMQDHPPPRRGAGDLPEQAPQAEAGLAPWRVSPASTCRSTSAPRSG